MFVDLLLMFLITKIKYKDSLIYMNLKGLYVFIDSNLKYNREGILNNLMKYPNIYNEYIHLDLLKGNNNLDNIDLTQFIKSLIRINSIESMVNIVDLAFNKFNEKFIEAIVFNKYDKIVKDTYIRCTNLINVNLLNDCLFVVQDLEKFKKLLKEKYNTFILLKIISFVL